MDPAPAIEARPSSLRGAASLPLPLPLAGFRSVLSGSTRVSMVAMELPAESRTGPARTLIRIFLDKHPAPVTGNWLGKHRHRSASFPAGADRRNVGVPGA